MEGLSDIRMAQLRMLDMLSYVDRVCREKNIEYSLDGGSVLGAIRHGGFIPWDDDVDIILTRENYKKLCDALLVNPHPQYVLQTPETDRLFLNHWNVLRDTKSEYIQDSVVHNLRKYRGFQVDLFPIDENVIVPLHRAISLLHNLNQKYVLGRFNGLAKLLFNISRKILIPSARFISRLSGSKGIYTYGYGLPWNKWRYPGSALFPYKPIVFEGQEFSGPNDPDEFLKIHYGNYMELPPEDKRNPHKAIYKIWQ